MTASIRLKPLCVSVAIPLLGGMASAFLAGDMEQAYESMLRPSFAPPPWVFAVVWPILYLGLGIACYMIWELEDSATRTQALTAYAVQLILNFLWPLLFFRFGLYEIAFWEICALLVVTLLTTGLFAYLKKKTLFLMLPYVLWLVYACALNKAIAMLN